MERELADTVEEMVYQQAEVEDLLRRGDVRMHLAVSTLLKNVDAEGAAALTIVGPSLFRWLDPAEQKQILEHSALWATVMRDADTL